MIEFRNKWNLFYQCESEAIWFFSKLILVFFKSKNIRKWNGWEDSFEFRDWLTVQLLWLSLNSFQQQEPNFFLHLQMKVIVALVIVALCMDACLSQSNSTEEHSIVKRAARKPKGRFLSLPIPQKCIARKCFLLNESAIRIGIDF